MASTGLATSAASDSSGAHKCCRMETAGDGKSKEARSGDTVGCSSRCDLLPFSPPPPSSHGHCVPKGVSKKEGVEATAAWPILPPAAMAVGCNVWETILAVGPGRHACFRRRCAARRPSCQIHHASILEAWRCRPMASSESAASPASQLPARRDSFHRTSS